MHTDPLKIANLIAWLETMPADTEYEYASNRDCLLAQFLKACGCTDVTCGSFSIDYNGLQDEPLPVGWWRIALGRPRTFGAALERAKALA